MNRWACGVDKSWTCLGDWAHTHIEYLGCIYIIYNKIIIILFDILWWYIIIDIKFFSITNQQKAK